MEDKFWFQIIPINDVALAILNDTRNRHCVTPSLDGTKRISITFNDNFKPDCILSFGRERPCSVVCDPPELPEQISSQFSRSQCRLFLKKDTLIIRDDSSYGTTHIRPWPDNSNLWEFPRNSFGIPRQRAVPERGVWILTLGPAKFVLIFPNNDKWWKLHTNEKKDLANRNLPTVNDLPTCSQTWVQTPRIPEYTIHDSVQYYELEYLGEGSFGRVSRVLDLQRGGIMAVKVINVQREKDKETKEAVKREVKILAKLSHRHIIKYIHSQGWGFGKPIEIFMSAADGSLRSFLNHQMSQHIKMAKGQITCVSRHIISALHYLHGKKIIHRDIKPENILFKDIFTKPIFILADFGLSKEIDSKASFVGTLPYLAPEVRIGVTEDFRVDIWSLGVVIYEMLTGLALGNLPNVPNHVFQSIEWCKMLELACCGGGDLAKMVTFNVEERITIDRCYTSFGFPVLPDALPSPVTLTPYTSHGE